MKASQVAVIAMLLLLAVAEGRQLQSCGGDGATCWSSKDCCSSAPVCNGNTLITPGKCRACITSGNECPNNGACCSGTCGPNEFGNGPGEGNLGICT